MLRLLLVACVWWAVDLLVGPEITAAADSFQINLEQRMGVPAAYALNASAGTQVASAARPQ